jgi:hypothetical protein
MGMRMIVAVRRNRATIVGVMLFRAIDVQGASTADRARQSRWADGLVDDLADGAGAAAALGAAAQAAVNMAGRTASRCARSITHFVVGQHIAGADDHPAIELIARPEGVNENRSLNWF